MASICAYSLSSQYGPIVRFLIYPLTFFLLVGHHAPWFGAGSLKALLTYCAIAAIHSAAMARYSSPEVYDFDALPAYNACVVGLLVAAFVVLNSHTAIESKGRLMLLEGFALLCSIGVVSFAAVGRKLQGRSACSVDDAKCEKKCVQQGLPMRTKQEPPSLSAYPEDFFQHARVASTVVAVLVLLHVFISFILAHGRIERKQRIRHTTDARSTEDPWHRPKEKKKNGPFILRLWQLLSLLLIPAWCGYFEYKVLKDLPQVEGADAVEQWSPLVATLLVSLSSTLTRKADSKGEAEKRKWPASLEADTAYPPIIKEVK